MSKSYLKMGADIQESWSPDVPSSLTTEQAMAIWEYKRHSTYRALSMAFFGFECQMEGQWLSQDAACLILNKTLIELCEIKFDRRTKISKTHESASPLCKGYFWWE